MLGKQSLPNAMKKAQETAKQEIRLAD